MSSTFGGLNTAYRGLVAQQIGLETTGHNVSNSSTDGYSRQTTNLSTVTPETIYGANGTVQKGVGVQVTSITRARDALIDKQMWRETSTLSGSTATQAELRKLETVFSDTPDTGIQSVLNDFWTSLQTLSTTASDDAARTTVRERGVELVNAVQDAATQLKNMVTDVNSSLTIKVKTINETTSEICSLNKQIVNIEAGGTDNANDLRDKRDLLVDQLSKVVDVRVTEAANGSFSVQSGGIYLVSGYDNIKLSTSATIDPNYGYSVTNIVAPTTGSTVRFSNGEVAALTTMRDSTTTGIKGYLNNLSTISQFLLQDFNAVSRSGYGSDNSTNNNFFGAAIGGVTNPDYNTSAVSGAFTSDDWISNLQVNQDLFTTGGIAKIAAKSIGASIGVTQSNLTGGSAAVFATGTYTAGSTPTPVMIKATGVTAGVIDNIQYSTDGGVTYNGTDIPVSATTGSYSLTIAGLTVAVNIGSTGTTTNAVNDTYSFSLNKNTADSSLTVTQSNSSAGAGTISSATGSYTNGDTATSVIVKAFDSTTTSITATGQYKQIKYSTDGGTNWSTTPTTLNSDGTFTIPISGISVKLQLATNTNNKSTDQYNFTISKGNVASGDNAVLMCNRLKIDTSAKLGNSSLDSYYSTMISDLGVQSQNAIRLTDNQQNLVDQVTTWRSSVSGVNMDEEITNMLKYQKGYNAAARVMTTIDEMLDKLINGTGIVGR